MSIEIVQFDADYDFRQTIEVNQYDYIPIDTQGKFENTPEGYIKVIAPVAKIGIYRYLQVDGSVRRDLVDEDTLFQADSMETLQLKPVTNDHPQSLLDSQTTRYQKVGFTGEKVYRNADYLMSSFVVTDSEAVDDVKSKRKTQLSPGYKVTLLFGKGKFNGEEYDARQTMRRYNHLAICTKARGGSDLKINVDQFDGETIIQGKGAVNMPKFKIGTVEYDTAPEVIAHIDSLSGQLTGTKSSLDKLQAQVDADTAKLPVFIEAAVKEALRITKLGDALGVTGIDALPAEGKRIAILKNRYPTLDLTDKSPEYLNGLIDSIEVKPANQGSPAAQAQVKSMTAGDSAGVKSTQTPLQQYTTRLQDAWKTPASK
jgi:hypothetical protein